MNLNLHFAQLSALHAAESISSAAWAKQLSSSPDLEQQYLKSARDQLALATEQLAEYTATRTAKIVEFPASEINVLAGSGANRL